MPPVETYFFSTTNIGKIREAASIAESFGFALKGAPKIVEVEEDGLTFELNARKKACENARQNKLFIIAEDSGLEVDAFKGLPGVYSARFCELNIDSTNWHAELGSPLNLSREEKDELNNQRLAELIQTEENRSARYVCVLAVSSPSGEILATARGECELIVITKPRGDGGFGYDPFVIPKEIPNKTFAELGLEEKNKISHRKRAWENLLKSFPLLKN